MVRIRSARKDGFMTSLHRLAFVGLLAFAGAGCGDDTTAGGADMSVADMSMCSGGGPVTGAADNHCFDDGGANFVAVDPAMCTIDAGGGGGPGDFGATMFGTSGNDDDCKYAVSWSLSGGGVCAGFDTFFVVTLKDALMNKPVAGATGVRPEVFNTASMAPVNTSKSTTTETSPGVYKIGPINFPSAGNYTVRFHFFESCTDTPTSPHGHAAFFVTVK
jgi:hypothetical protein